MTDGRRGITSKALLSTIGGLVLAGCLPVALGLAISLTYWMGGPGFHPYAFWLYYVPALGFWLLVIWASTTLALAAGAHRLGVQKTYVPAMMLVVWCIAMMLASRVVVQEAIRAKIENADNRSWSEAMVSRALGGYPTGVTCVLGEQVVVLVREWSFVRPDGRMPVLAWSSNSMPNSGLPGTPGSCNSLQKNWYVCYLAKPYQLRVPTDVCG